MNTIWPWICLAFILAVSVLYVRANSAANSAQIVDGVITGHVIRIADGDGIYLDGLEKQIRIWGIQASEYDEPGGTEATQFLTTLAYGRSVRCAFKHNDRYGRIVAQCLLQDGRDLAAELIKLGHATEHKYYSKGFYAHITRSRR